ncbi:MAG: CHAP domain-containing protein, partial [Rikenellaceae bacterium]
GDKAKQTKLRLDKAETKVEQAKAKIPKKKQRDVVFDLADEPKAKSNVAQYSKASGKAQSNRLYEKEKPQSKLDFAESRAKPPSKLVDKPKPQSKLERQIQSAPKNTIASTLHNEVAKNEDDNVGVKSAHSVEKGSEFVSSRAKSAYHSHKLKPYANLEKAEKKLEKAQVNHSFEMLKKDNPYLTSNPISRFQQKRAIKKQYANAHRVINATQGTVSAVKGTVKQGVNTVAQSVGAVAKNPKMLLILGIMFLVFVLFSSALSSCSVMVTGGFNAVTGTSYNSEDEDIVEVDNNYTALEDALQEQIDNIESDYPDYDEYRYNLDDIVHNPHEVASYLTALLQYYTTSEAQTKIEQLFDMQYTLELQSEVEIRYRTESRTDSEGNSYTVQVPYEYHILNVTLTNTPIREIAPDELNAEQLELFEVLLETSGNKPFLFGGGSINDSPSTNLSGVEFVDGERAGNQAIADIALSQLGNVGGQPYWSWYGFDYRVEWCATFVSWALHQSGYTEPKFASCQSQGVPYFTSNGQWANRGYSDIAAGDVIFFDWQGDGRSDHVGIVIGTDGNRVYTVEGNSGDACKVRDYAINSSVIMGYGLMN